MESAKNLKILRFSPTFLHQHCDHNLPTFAEAIQERYSTQVGQIPEPFRLEINFQYFEGPVRGFGEICTRLFATPGFEECTEFLLFAPSSILSELEKRIMEYSSSWELSHPGSHCHFLTKLAVIQIINTDSLTSEPTLNTEENIFRFKKWTTTMPYKFEVLALSGVDPDAFNFESVEKLVLRLTLAPSLVNAICKVSSLEMIQMPDTDICRRRLARFASPLKPANYLRKIKFFWVPQFALLDFVKALRDSNRDLNERPALGCLRNLEIRDIVPPSTDDVDLPSSLCEEELVRESVLKEAFQFIRRRGVLNEQVEITINGQRI
ncbi:hypothetical protein BDQ12DRAFT_663537 [Crucibulum laeve]|uniref:Uncharacterized protein n=1 Tax=Crucibulum laeve TaxID=68775 RepID=A0A5C3M7T1_9AGAR|nr:hypothetical protein BDQ12DRAFT_663537 [Crucibulum laeve]